MVNPAEPSRIAVCLRRGVGTAPVRSRLRRVVRESAEKFVPNLAPGFHIALLPSRDFEKLKPDLRSEAIGSMLRRCRLLREVPA